MQPVNAKSLTANLPATSIRGIVKLFASCVLLALAVSCGGSEKPVAKLTDCDAVIPPGQIGPNTLRPFICAPVANCVATNTGTTDDLAEAACRSVNGGACKASNCGPTSISNCVPKYAKIQSSGISFANFVNSADPSCPGVQRRCTADLIIPAGGKLECSCACEN